ncbi:MAG: hypothetical protein P8011_12285 [Acidihalobacter sp.]|uniref:hypothetical protein n=1 Tax=Acidihalobacter sp. TaxID=1872108 RepID=UPI00307F24A9
MSMQNSAWNFGRGRSNVFPQKGLSELRGFTPSVMRIISPVTGIATPLPRHVLAQGHAGTKPTRTCQQALHAEEWHRIAARS